MNLEDKIKELKQELSGDKEGLRRVEEVAKLYTGDDEIVSSKEIEEMMKNEPEEARYYSGFDGVDKILEGFREQQLIVLTGITKHGKTTFAMDLVNNLKEHAPLVLPFEEPAKELIRKFKERGMEVPHFYTPRTPKDHTLEWIEEKIVESKAKFGSRIVFIDHLGYVRDGRSRQENNKADRLEVVMQDIKSLAKKWDVVIVLLVHLKKVQLDRTPDLDDIRGSGSIAQEADTVMIMWRKTQRVNGEVEITNEATLSIQANRRTGTTGNVHLIFENGKYIEDDWNNAEKNMEKLKEPKQDTWTQDF